MLMRRLRGFMASSCSTNITRSSASSSVLLSTTCRNCSEKLATTTGIEKGDSPLSKVVPSITASSMSADTTSGSSSRSSRQVIRTTPVEGWVNVTFLVGIVHEVKIGLIQGSPAIELKLLVSEVTRSIEDTPQSPKHCSDKTVFEVVAVGHEWCEMVRKKQLHKNSIAHIHGRLYLQPRYMGAVGKYEYKPLIQVRENCGGITVVKSEVISPTRRLRTDLARRKN